MKASALDLRERVVKFLQAGGSKVEAARRFAVGRRTVYRVRPIFPGELKKSQAVAGDFSWRARCQACGVRCLTSAVFVPPSLGSTAIKYSCPEAGAVQVHQTVWRLAV